jgi:DNA-binding YbaB/EbfC family protein
MNIQNMMKQAQQMQAKLATLQNELAARELDVSVGGGAMKVRISGKQEILSIKLSPDAVDPNDVATLEELVMTGINQAIKESQDMVSSAMSKITGGMNLPGMF